MKPIGACGEWLAFDVHVVGKGDDVVFVGTSALDLAVGNFLAEELPAADERTAVVHRDVGEADALGDDGALADRRELEFRGLGAVLELRAGRGRQSCRCQQKTQEKVLPRSHAHPFFERGEF